MRSAPLSATAELGSPALVLAAHGSPHPAHLPSLATLRDAVREAFESLPIGPEGRHGSAPTPAPVPSTVELGWLDFADPGLATCVRTAATRVGPRQSTPAVVVVPLLLTSGYHARVDIPAMLLGIEGVVVTEPLGPDPAIARALIRRLEAAGADDGEDVVLGAAGSADQAALRDVEAVAALLAKLRTGAVEVGYVTGAGPRLDTVLAKGGGTRNGTGAIATYLLGDGSMADAIRESASRYQAAGTESPRPARTLPGPSGETTAGRIVVTEPLGAAPEVVDLVIRRWDDAVRAFEQ